MSNLNAIGLIFAILIFGGFAISYTTHVIHLRSDAITTGIVRGVSISIKERWMILFHDWVPAAFGIAVFGVILALGQLEIAQQVTDEGIKLLAWLSAGLAGFTSAFWLILGISYFTNCVLILREAGRS
jgi:hypothetical protein